VALGFYGVNLIFTPFECDPDAQLRHYKPSNPDLEAPATEPGLLRFARNDEFFFVSGAIHDCGPLSGQTMVVQRPAWSKSFCALFSKSAACFNRR
jgi:hypothetical protein